MVGGGRLVGAAAGVSLGAALSRSALWVGRSAVAANRNSVHWDRTNHRGHIVSLLAGPAYVVGAAAGVALTPAVAPRLKGAAVLATAAAGGVGLLDDLAGSGTNRGLRGHLFALRRGQLSTGAVKVLGLVVAGLAAARLLGHRRGDALVSGAVIAGAANLVNLLDLRPGRAIKVGLAHAPALLLPTPGAAVLAAPLGAAAGLLADDLGERTMLGDAGANALGAAIGVAAVASYGRAGRLAHLGGIAGLTLLSEWVSFTQVIDQAPALRWLDGLGRRR